MVRVLDLEPDPNDKVFAVLVTFKKDDGEEYKKLYGPFFDDGTSDNFVKEEVEWHPKFGREIVKHEILLVHPTYEVKTSIQTEGKWYNDIHEW